MASLGHNELIGTFYASVEKMRMICWKDEDDLLKFYAHVLFIHSIVQKMKNIL